MTYLLSFLAFWLACGFVAAGFVFAYYQTEYAESADINRKPDMRYARSWLWDGAIGLCVAIVLHRYRHGWRKWW